MTRDEIRESFIKLILPFAVGVDRDMITDSTSLTNDMRIDSTDFVDIVLGTEDTFGIQIDSGSMERLTTVGSAVKMILDKQAPAG